MRMNRLTFRTTPFAGVPGSRWVTPVIDGVPLTDSVAAFERSAGVRENVGGYAGIVLGPSGDPLVDDLLAGGSQLAVLGCGCSDTGCWPLEVDISIDDWSVTWDGFRQPHRPRRSYHGFGPFIFQLIGYRAAVEGLREA